jgi:hypothetical protein
MENYINELTQDFARHGFISSPLTRDQAALLYSQGVSLGRAYSIGCDVGGGFTFQECAGDITC